MTEEQDLREQLRGAIKSRAMVYYQVYQELIPEVGEDKAKEILKRAIYKRGLAIGRRFREHAPDDLEGLKKAFMHFVPDHGGMFNPQVLREDREHLDIHMAECPLKEAWQEAGVDDGTLATMCEIAGIVDNGTFEGAGFSVTGETWKPGRTGCCTLHITPGLR
ncbi:MAG: L-2-amino-thiazoline-4-carboxylic acid hydrolase [Spirochaetota bacterium]